MRVHPRALHPGCCSLHHARGPSTLHRVSAPRTLRPEPCSQSVHTASGTLHPSIARPSIGGPACGNLDPAPRHHLRLCAWTQHSAPQHPGTLYHKPDTQHLAPRAQAMHSKKALRTPAPPGTRSPQALLPPSPTTPNPTASSCLSLHTQCAELRSKKEVSSPLA